MTRMINFKEYDTQEYPSEKQYFGMALYNCLPAPDKEKFGKEFDDYLTETHAKGEEQVTPFWKYCLERLEVRVKEATK